MLSGSFFSSAQVPGVCSHIVSGFSDGGSLHLRVSGLQIRKRYHNQQSDHREGRKHVEESYLFREQQRGDRGRRK